LSVVIVASGRAKSASSSSRSSRPTTSRRFPPICNLGGRDRRRSGDPTLFRRVLCRLSYPALFVRRARADAPPALPFLALHAVLTGFEPAASALTGRRALQTAPQD